VATLNAVQGMRPYHHSRYQADELSESFEQQMLLQLQRDAADDGEDVDDEKEVAQSTMKRENMQQHSDMCFNTGLDSSDEDNSTIKSSVRCFFCNNLCTELNM
jgi:hypothetical protein